MRLGGKYRIAIIALLVAAAFTLIAYFSVVYKNSSGYNNNILYKADMTIADALYQKTQPASGEIFLIGIDSVSIEALGAYHSWGREYMAMALEMLNGDPEFRPAVIGIDVIYAGYSDEGSDEYLVEAAALHDNVVFAAAANFGEDIMESDDGTFKYINDAVLSFDTPFEELLDVSSIGHINNMNDADNILRHGLQYVQLPDGTRVPSLNQQLYQKYAAHHGLDGTNLPPPNDKHFWYVPFTGAVGSYFSASFIDLLTGSIDPQLYADKIVMIGPYSQGMLDHFFTAIDHTVQMNGVEYQANQVEAMLRGEFKREVGNLFHAILLFILLIASVLWFNKRKVLPSVIAWLIVSGGWIGICILAFNNGYVLQPLWIPLFITIIFIASVAANYIRAALEKLQITNTFKRYVAPEVVNEILKNREALELGGKLSDIAVLFVDIRGFTTMSEQLSPPEVVEILNLYLDLTSSCIFNNGGTLDKFIGDATMAFWGAPLPQDDIVYKAALTAIEMVTRSHVLAEQLMAKHGRSVSFGIGIHYGPAVVGNIGAAMRMDYTAIGDTVNTAARLESNAPAGSILISRAVADALEGRIRVTSLGNTIKLKGKSDDFEILRLDGLAEPKNEPDSNE